jgi:WASH complex subunit strumpellin
MQFLDEQNLAGQSLLRLVARANAIIAELLRLSAHIPPVFKLEDRATQKKYGEILMDFSYVSKADYFQQRIDRDPVRLFHCSNSAEGAMEGCNQPLLDR